MKISHLYFVHEYGEYWEIAHMFAQEVGKSDMKLKDLKVDAKGKIDFTVEIPTGVDFIMTDIKLDKV